MMKRELLNSFCDQLRDIGVKEGDVVLVHSSLSSLGYVPGGASSVLEGLHQTVGEKGTLLLPALSYETVTPENPYFDVLRTPSNVGAIPEYFRKNIAQKRSMNPTHSVSGLGRFAHELLSEHSLDDTPCGEHSPFQKLPKYNGKILFMGCGLSPNTSMHAIEEHVNPPYLFGEYYTYRMLDENGNESMMKCRSHGFKGWKQRYDRMESLLNENQMHTGEVLGAKVYLMDAGALWEKALPILKQDPLYFVDRDENGD
jgi:aminoglycoside 3-N-acetyltransferase